MINSLSQELPAGDSDLAAFIHKMSIEIAIGDVRLPSLPDIAARVQKVLEDPLAARSQVAQVIRTDAALAARILRLANSAFLNPGNQQITDLQQALTRLGHQLVRCTAVSFSIQQMQLGANEAQFRPQLRYLWGKGTLIASIALVLARETRAAKPDEALMAGLMHNIGRLYLTVSAPGRATGEGSTRAWERTVQDWHPRIASAILKHWRFPPAIIAAVEAQNDWIRETPDHDGLADVLRVATALEPCVFQRELLDDMVTAALPFRRLGLGSVDCQRLFQATAHEIKALRAALSS
jgi:HD-like signal output (HDOD) protein